MLVWARLEPEGRARTSEIRENERAQIRGVIERSRHINERAGCGHGKLRRSPGKEPDRSSDTSEDYHTLSDGLSGAWIEAHCVQRPRLRIHEMTGRQVA